MKKNKILKLVRNQYKKEILIVQKIKGAIKKKRNKNQVHVIILKF